MKKDETVTLLIGIPEMVSGLVSPIHQVLNGQNARIAELCCAHVNDHVSLKGATAWDMGTDYGLSLTELYANGVASGRGVEMDPTSQQVASLWWEASPLTFFRVAKGDATINRLYSDQELILAMTRREKAIKRVHRGYGGQPPQMDVMLGDVFDVLRAGADEPRKYERDVLIGCMVLHHLVHPMSYRVLLHRMAKLVRVGGVLAFGLSSGVVKLTDTQREARLWRKMFRNEPFYIRAAANLVAQLQGEEQCSNPDLSPKSKWEDYKTAISEAEIRSGAPNLEFLGLREQEFTQCASVDLMCRRLLTQRLKRLPEFMKVSLVNKALASARTQSTDEERYAIGRDTLYTFAYRRIA